MFGNLFMNEEKHNKEMPTNSQVIIKEGEVEFNLQASHSPTWY